MPIARSPREEFEFVLFEDREREPNDIHRTTWKIRPLSRIERMKMRDRFEAVQSTDDQANEVRLKANAGTLRQDILLAGLIGYDRLHDEDGDDHPFELEEKPREIFGRTAKRMNPDLLDLLDDDQCDELFSAIMEENHLTTEEGNG